ncbi:hypothetical protein KSS87_017038, partial [Heliosperma pusillum]
MSICSSLVFLSLPSSLFPASICSWLHFVSLIYPLSLSSPIIIFNLRVTTNSGRFIFGHFRNISCHPFEAGARGSTHFEPLLNHEKETTP